MGRPQDGACVESNRFAVERAYLFGAVSNRKNRAALL